MILGIASSILRFLNFTLNLRISNKCENVFLKGNSDFSAPVRLSEKFEHKVHGEVTKYIIIYVRQKGLFFVFTL